VVDKFPKIECTGVVLSDQQFDRARELALDLAGIELLERHRELLDRRFGRAGILAEAIDAILIAAENGETSATQQLLCLLTTKFTGFFRHPRQFEVAAEHALRAASEHGMARLWSAAAATGEEPWSLAMALIGAFERDDPPASILATDVDATALAVAQRGEYGEETLRSLQTTQRERFFVKAPAARRGIITPVVRRLVEFRLLNLANVAWPVTGPLDVIFCRNVVMYLEAGCRYAVLERMASLLAEGGLLILDPAEHLGKAGQWFSKGMEGVYMRRKASATRRDGTWTSIHPDRRR
jgi:chemotaxis protein methyltransferase CheR